MDTVFSGAIRLFINSTKTNYKQRKKREDTKKDRKDGAKKEGRKEGTKGIKCHAADQKREGVLLSHEYYNYYVSTTTGSVFQQEIRASEARRKKAKET